MPESPTPLLEQDTMTELGTIVLVAAGQTLNCLPLLQIEINPQVWAAQGKEGHALTMMPVRIQFKDPVFYPCGRQYPLKPEVRKGLTEIISNLKKQGLLKKCDRPYNTPILGAWKPNED